MFFSQLCHTVALWPWRMRLIPLCFQVPPEPQGSSAGRGCQGFVWKRCAACWVPLVGHAQCLCRWHTVKWMEAGHPNKMFCIIKVSDRIPSDTLLGVVWRQVRRNEGIPVTAGSAPLKAKGNSLKALHRAEEPACTGCTSLGLFRGSISSPQHRMISCRSTALPVEAAGLDPGCREALLIPAQRPRRGGGWPGLLSHCPRVWFTAGGWIPALFCEEHHLLQEGMAGAWVLTVRDYTTNRLGWDTTQTSFFP